MDDLFSQGLKLATLEPPLSKPSQDLFGTLAPASLMVACHPSIDNDQDGPIIQAALIGETKLNRDTIADNTGTTTNISAGDSLTGFINIRGDHDWIRTQLTAGNTYRFNLIRLNGQLDPLLGLRSSTGALITQNDNSEGTLNSTITFTATSTGTYYLDTGSYNNASTGKYHLLATQLSTDQFAANTGTTGTIAIGGNIASNIDSLGDHDWFKIALTAGKNYVFNLNKVGTQGLSDPLLSLRNSTGALLTSNDDANGTLNSQITFSATTSGTYFLDAGAYADSATGQYQLLAAEVTPVAPPPAGYSATTGYGEASVKRALEQMLGTSLPSVADLGGIFWGLDRLGAPEAWNAGYTGSGITVAVVDTGVDYTHGDLDANIWINSREIAGNGIDDDGNGFIDDVRGWNFASNTNNVMDDNSHGTHVSGTIAGENNGVGITGVAYNAKIMAVKVLDASGSGTLSNVARGIRYAADNGASVINLSLGGGGSQELLDAVAYASSRGAVVVMAAGNDGGASPNYPAAYAQYYGLAVGAIDSAGALASFSNRAGTTPLDYITAAGVSVYSSVPGGGYATYSGTSMATPHIAGAMALLQQANRVNNKGLSVAALETLLTSTASNMVTAGLQTTSTRAATTSVATSSRSAPTQSVSTARRAKGITFATGSESTGSEQPLVIGADLGQPSTPAGRAASQASDPISFSQAAADRIAFSGGSGGTSQVQSAQASLTDTLVEAMKSLQGSDRYGRSVPDRLTGLSTDLDSLSPWFAARS